ncbi:MAG: hypothetical protein HQL69_18465 [Magnetococcales bacterium]|nr:hypothetical protein [Magnetococcales bacterium]
MFEIAINMGKWGRAQINEHNLAVGGLLMIINAVKVLSTHMRDGFYNENVLWLSGQLFYRAGQAFLNHIF